MTIIYVGNPCIAATLQVVELRSLSFLRANPAASSHRHSRRLVESTPRAQLQCCDTRNASAHSAQRIQRTSSIAPASLRILPHSNNDRVANHGVHDSLSLSRVCGATRDSVQAAELQVLLSQALEVSGSSEVAAALIVADNAFFPILLGSKLWVWRDSTQYFAERGGTI